MFNCSYWISFAVRDYAGLFVEKNDEKTRDSSFKKLFVLLCRLTNLYIGY